MSQELKYGVAIKFAYYLVKLCCESCERFADI